MNLENLVLSSTTDALKNTIRDNLSITVTSGSQGSSTQVTFTGSKTISEENVSFSQLLLQQDNIAGTTGGELEATDEYLYYNGSVQLLLPATVPTAGALQEVPAQVYFLVDGTDFSATIYVNNPFPDTITRQETTVTFYLYGYDTFQGS